MKLPKTRRELVAHLEAQGLRPRKKWGQNFLADPNLLEAIVRDAEINPRSLVLEIGPGPGTLTEYLMAESRFVLAIEIDRGLAAMVRAALAERENLLLLTLDAMGAHNQLNPELERATRTLLAGEMLEPSDALLSELEIELPAAQPELAGVQVIANLPYSISSPLLIALLESDLPITSLTLLLQLEVAQKLIAQPGDRDYGLLSLMCGLKAKGKILRKIGGQCFWPPAGVTSALIRIEPRDDALEGAEYTAVKEVAQGFYHYRRKSLVKGAQHGFGMSAIDARAWLARAEVAESAHVEALSVAELQRLAATRE